MNLLFDPNIAYLLLVVGSVLLLLAIVTPGTGLLELGAAFLLIVAGYAIYNIGFELWALIVLVIAFVPFVYAIQKPKREWALVLSLLGLIVGSLYLFPSKGLLPVVNPVLAILVSAGAAGFIWLVTRKVIAAHFVSPFQDLKRLIGQSGEAKSQVHDEGSVQVAGELWSARSEKSIPAGSRVRVLDRQGFTLVVERDDQAKK
jgi:membrane-bound ClpP family serine protease